MHGSPYAEVRPALGLGRIYACPRRRVHKHRTKKTADPKGRRFATRDYAFTFSFALLASALNAAMSFTARSASILRFTVMPASFKPCIMRL